MRFMRLLRESDSKFKYISYYIIIINRYLFKIMTCSYIAEFCSKVKKTTFLISKFVLIANFFYK